jgi:dihydroorotate dehydrogenase
VPDWSYQPVFRPLLFRLSAPLARDLALGAMGRLARVPLGPAVIDFLGHMGPPPGIGRRVLGLDLASPLGLAAGLDPAAQALPALARFGFGFLELGPVTAEPVAGRPVERRPERQALWYPEEPANPGLDALVRRLARDGPVGVPLAARLAHAPGASAADAAHERCRLITALTRYVAFFTLKTEPQTLLNAWGADGWAEHLRTVLGTSVQRPVLLCLAPDTDVTAVESRLGPALAAGVLGVVVAGGIAAEGGRLLGAPERGPARDLVRHLRGRYGASLPIVAAGGVLEPADALELFAAGADLVLVHSGLVYSGPGLPKRINEALDSAAQSPAPTPPPRPGETSWFWLALMGTGMLLGGALALAIAATRVVLPYDEVFVGLSRAELASANDRLLSFLAHDRVSLAGTMLAIGLLYLQLAAHGVRRGRHWARLAVLTSAWPGLASFFLFLGFGYLDTLHAFVTAVLAQLLFLGVHGRLSPRAPPGPPDLHNGGAWRRSLWGQLLLVAHAVALLTAGLVIAGYGVSVVFVPEDLEFMQTTADRLAAVSPRLLPMIAHDRATFGAMLVCCGLGLLTTSLWGFRPGSRWLWWTLLGVGLAGYVPALAVHLVVGYTNLWHLSPALGGLALYLAGLALSHSFLCRRVAIGPPMVLRGTMSLGSVGCQTVALGGGVDPWIKRQSCD